MITDTDSTDSGRVRVDPVHETEESTVSDAVVSPPPKKKLQECNRTDGSPSLLGPLLKAIGFQFNLMTSLVKSPPFDPFTTFKLARRFLLTQVSVFSEILFRTLKLSGFKDTKRTVNVACKFGWGLFRAFYVGVLLYGLPQSRPALSNRWGFSVKADRLVPIVELGDGYIRLSHHERRSNGVKS